MSRMSFFHNHVENTKYDKFTWHLDFSLEIDNFYANPIFYPIQSYTSSVTFTAFQFRKTNINMLTILIYFCLSYYSHT